jgi:hypothetical protein
MDFIYWIVFSLFLNLLLDKPAVHNTEPPPPRPIQTLKVEAPQSITIPRWVTHTPEHCFVGISNPCQSIEQARQHAIHSAFSQILQTMGAEYSLTHKSILSGNLHYSHHELRERLTYTARWFIRSVQQNIRESDVKQVKGKYIYFILVNFPPGTIQRLRKLTIGPKVSARIVKEINDQLVIEVREINGVQVTLTDYHIKTKTKNRYAGFITMFAFKVPELLRRNFEGVIRQKISLKENSQTLNIPNPTPDTSIKDLILGAETQIKILLQGHDEVGRPVSVPVNKF